MVTAKETKYKERTPDTVDRDGGRVKNATPSTIFMEDNMRKLTIVLASLVLLALLTGAIATSSISAAPNAAPPGPKFSTAVAFDVSPALRDVTNLTRPLTANTSSRTSLA